MPMIPGTGKAPEQLLALIERIERLEEERRATAADIKDVYGEAKAAGFDIKTMKKIVAERRMDRDQLIEEQELLNTYRAAVQLILPGINIEMRSSKNSKTIDVDIGPVMKARQDFIDAANADPNIRSVSVGTGPDDMKVIPETVKESAQ